MALSDIELIKLKVDYQSGKLNRSKIAQKHRISRTTLVKHAKKEGWEFGKSEQELYKEIEEKVYKKLVDIEVDRATETTNNYLKDFNLQRQFLTATSAALTTLIRDKKNKLTKEDAELILARARVHKMLMEGYNIGYMAVRKALGMDREDDINKALKIKDAERQPITDPTEGMTEEDVDKQLENFK